MSSLLDARFLPGSRGNNFVVTRRPAAAGGHAVLLVPPFAEEMNKSRRMLAQAASGLARSGIAAVMPDLHGTGDSQGEFRDADWDVWVEDLVGTAHWLAGEGWPVRALLCVRLGCLLGAEAAQRIPGIRASVFWQPVVDGERYVVQFLRLRMAATMMSDGPKESVAVLRDALRSQAVEVAGYEFTDRLARQIEQRGLVQLSGSHLGKVDWMEVAASADSGPGQGSMRAIEALKAQGVAGVHASAFEGQPFWTSTEIVEVDPMVTATVGALVQA